MKSLFECLVSISDIETKFSFNKVSDKNTVIFPSGFSFSLRVTQSVEVSSQPISTIDNSSETLFMFFTVFVTEVALKKLKN